MWQPSNTKEATGSRLPTSNCFVNAVIGYGAYWCYPTLCKGGGVVYQVDGRRLTHWKDPGQIPGTTAIHGGGMTFGEILKAAGMAQRLYNTVAKVPASGCADRL